MTLDQTTLNYLYLLLIAVFMAYVVRKTGPVGPKRLRDKDIRLGKRRRVDLMSASLFLLGTGSVLYILDFLGYGLIPVGWTYLLLALGFVPLLWDWLT